MIFNAAPREGGGVAALSAGPGADVASLAAVTVTESDGGHVLDNGRLRVAIDGRGLVTSVYDLDHDREVLPPGRVANLLQLHPDLPVQWDAWDVDAYYRRIGVDLVELDALEVSGPDEAGAVTVRVTRSFGASTVVQDITLRPGVRRLDLAVDVDWQEHEKFLKVALPIDVHADRAAYETQFGHVYRATHENTTWEAAKFEVCAHRWVHVGEPGYGVAVVNDATYGHDVRRERREGGGTSTTVRLSLLRGPRFPDPEADQDRHVLRYSLVPGATIADAVREGYAINLPERRIAGVGSCRAGGQHRGTGRRRARRRGGEAGRRPVRRRRRPALRVARRPGRRTVGPEFRVHLRRRDRPTRTSGGAARYGGSARGRPARRSAPAAVPGRHAPDAAGLIMSNCCAPAADHGDDDRLSPAPVAPRVRDPRDVARGMVRVAGGPFLMGGEDPDAFPADGEGPVRRSRWRRSGSTRRR